MWHRWCEEQPVNTRLESVANRDPVEEQVAILIHEGEQLFESGHFLDAKCAFLHALEKDPDDITALNDLGVLYWHTGQPEKGYRDLSDGSCNRSRLPGCPDQSGRDP